MEKRMQKWFNWCKANNKNLNNPALTSMYMYFLNKYEENNQKDFMITTNDVMNHTGVDLLQFYSCLVKLSDWGFIQKEITFSDTHLIRLL